MNCETCKDTGKYTIRKLSSGMVTFHCECSLGQKLYHQENCEKKDACATVRGIMVCPCSCHEKEEEGNE